MQTILVPVDFTTISDYAVEHAVKYSRIFNLKITLLHIIKKESDYKDADDKMLLLADKINIDNQIRVDTIIREGSIFTTIGEVSVELDSELVIMGTHGMHGLQKITGSWALKVTVTSKAPVIIVQEPPKQDNIRRIVFPVDFKKENKEKIGWACFIAKHFNAKIYIFKSNFKDKGFIKSLISNMFFTEKYFKNRGIEYEISVSEAKSNFGIQTLDFANKIDADLILIMTTKAINYTDYLLGASEQHIIANSAKIPVMCVNPRPTSIGSFSTTGG
jgi:nucleotide-binding universal stress UspA family protein